MNIINKFIIFLSNHLGFIGKRIVTKSLRGVYGVEKK